MQVSTMKCKKDYPDILEELEKETIQILFDAGCGPALMISLSEKYPDRHYNRSLILHQL